MVTNIEDEKVLAFKRFTSDKSAIVVCNFSNDAVPWTIPEEFENSKIILSNYGRSKVSGANVVLKPYEAFTLLK